ncbi:peptidoglycan-binding protein [Geomicrobium sediminis]|uniref:3D (Asp-Asp-Asp) domain-containing protein n=1 Tax=Geomicrobium sediminis TaxID=1347788 RepID=A0ABS2PIV8_9BACL|nr:peptidoglycan-binding protein [Geomicrobium sediminis]MBM7635026.1 3D (Asp-Asp-Asp) domain-containing protein [Geomicrobium sediminis]
MKSIRKIAYSLGFTAFAAGFAFITAPTAADASDFNTDLENSSDVELLQETLIDKGYLNESEVTGEYDSTTTDAVQAYQSDFNLLSDGIAGTQTLGALAALSLEDEGELVEDLQSKLQNKGFDPVYVDGIFGPRTEEAVRDFQSAAGISVDGIAGPDTFGQLMYNDAPVANNNRSEEEPVAKEEEPAEETQSEETVASESTEPTESTESSSSESASSSNESPEGTTMTMEATAYTADCEGCSGITATGIDLRNDRNANVVAVDPNVIPLGSTVYVEGYGEAIAGDTGGAITGNKIDLHMATTEEALNFGRQNVEVTVLD